MQEKHLFEYAVIRVVPRVEREEFLNVGVILYCARPKFLELAYLLDSDRLLALYPALDMEELNEHLRIFGEITRGSMEGGPIGQLDIASRFRWLTATRSTILQTSKVHPGLCTDATVMLQRLFASLVL
jgi:hypothetical protein